MGWVQSNIIVLQYQPFKTDAQGNITQTLDGVFILLADTIVTWMKNNLTQAQKDEIDSWVNRYSEATCALWHAPVWAGDNSAVYLRIPATVWNDPTTAPPQKVKDYFKSLYA